jgi:hypothetical protein
MPHTRLASKRARLLAVYNVLSLWVGCAAAVLVAGDLAQRGSQSNSMLDLTAEVPRNEQGYYHGIPGMSGGRAPGAWQPGPGDTVRYYLPLGLEILHAVPNKDGDFVVAVLLRNTGREPFDLPSSRNITAVERPENRSRRVFFFKLLPIGVGTNEGETLGSAATGGTASIPGSFISLRPGESLRVMLPASSGLIRRAFTNGTEKLEVAVICQEWKLDDNRFFLSGISDELKSINRAHFAIHDDQLVYLQP